MKTIIRSLLLLLAAVASLRAAILTVDNNPGSVAMYVNFEDAYEAANDGDTILLAGSSSSYSSPTIYKRLKIVGAGYFLSENIVPGLNPNSSKISLTVDSDSLLGTGSGTQLIGLEGSFSVRSDVSGVIIDKCVSRAFQVWNVSSSVVMARCFAATVGSAVGFNSGSEGSIIRNSVIGSLSYNSVTGISADRCVITSAFNGNPSTSITNSIFVFSNSSSFARNGSSVSNCMAVGFDTLPTGAGNINGQLVGNVFLNTGSDDGKWRLKAGSPALGAGTGGSDMGAFGGPSPYVLSGIPGIPRPTRLVVPATATSTSGLQFEVDAQAFPE